MKILAINGTYRKKGTTTGLTEAALQGAASAGAETEMVMLQDHDVRYCTNCLMCYKDLDSEIAPCRERGHVTVSRGQGIFIDPKRKLIFDSNGNRPQASDHKRSDQDRKRSAFYRQVQLAIDREAKP